MSLARRIVAASLSFPGTTMNLRHRESRLRVILGVSGGIKWSTTKLSYGIGMLSVDIEARSKGASSKCDSHINIT
jgi:hypothetical protein